MSRRIRLYGATLLAVKTHFDNNASFSAYTITSYIRDMVDLGEWELWNGGDASSVKHKTVRAFIEELIDNDLFYKPYDVRVETDKDYGAKYKLYTPRQDSLNDDINDDYLFDNIIPADYNDEFTVSTKVSVNGVTIEKVGGEDSIDVIITSPTGNRMEI